MATIRPSSDLRNKYNEISEFCRTYNEPVFITKNGTGDLVVQSIEMYERQQAQLELYAKLAEAEARIANGEQNEDFNAVAGRMRNKLVGKLHGEI